MLLGKRYQLQEHLGSGAMGSVYRAVDRLTGQTIALKQMILSPDDLIFNARLTRSSIDANISLANEFQMLASLRHPHIISVQDYGFSSSLQPFFTMTLLENATNLIEAGYGQPLTIQANLLIQVLQALAYVHRRGILHRDLKPSNVLVRNEHVFVLDFGLATARDAQEKEVAGTIAYMAPEILSGGVADIGSDLYAVGVMAYEMLTGENPFMRDDITSSIVRILQSQPDLEKMDVPLALTAVIGRLLAKSPTDRYESAPDVIRAICDALNMPVPMETDAIRSSFLQAASFVGRERELKTLKDALIKLRSKDTTEWGTGWLIGGESGVGKSRLLDELATRAMVNGVLLLRGQAVTEGGVAYQIWREILRRIALFVDFTDDELSILKMIVPDIETLVGRAVPPAPDLPPQDLRTRLSLLVSTALDRAAHQQPILLILEDLQWVQDIQLLQDVLPLISTMCVMVVGTYRDDESPKLPAKLPSMELISLRRLSPDEIARLSISMLGDAGKQPQVVDLLQRETEGNVFFLVEVVRALAEDAGRLSEIGKVTLPAQIFAGGIQRVVDYRLSRVPAWAMPMVNLAAVSGRQIDPLIISTLDPSLDLDEWLTMCTNVAVFSVQDGVYRFAHDKLREGVLERFEQDERRDLHRRVAEAIESAYRGSLNDYAGMLVQHYAIAGNEQKEGRYAGIAAAGAHERQNFDDAVRLYRRALELRAYEQSHESQKVQADFLSGLGRSLYGLSEFDEARTVQQQALEIYQALGDEAGISDALNSIGETHFRQSRYHQAQEYLEQALEIRLRLNNFKDIGYSYMNLGVVQSHLGSYPQARGLFEQCYDYMKQDGEPVAIARALNNLAISYDLGGEVEKARELYRESLELRRRINDRQGIAYSLLNWAMLEESENNLELAEAYLEESYAMLKPIGQKMALATILSSMAKVARGRENFDKAREHEQQALVLRRRIGDRSGESVSLHGMGLILEAQEDYSGAIGFYKQGLKLASDIENNMNINHVLSSIGSVYQKTGQVDAAAQIVYVAFREGLHEFAPQRWEKLRDSLPDDVADDAGYSIAALITKILED